jgi:TrmH family RNA methyltransferase
MTKISVPMITKTITSKDNEKIKLLKKLRLKKYREKYNKFFVENFNIIKDAGAEIEALFITESFVKKRKQEVDLILKKCKTKEYYVIADDLNKSFSELETASGICAIYARREEKIDFKKSIIYLNGINDPGNLGTILRSALAFDFKNIVLDESCADLLNAKTISAAKDSIFKLNISCDSNLKILKNIKSKMKIFATKLEGGEDIAILKKEKIFCLVLGSEARGVSKEIEKLSDKFVKIKMSGEIESLNVASAAAVIFYEARSIV